MNKPNNRRKKDSQEKIEKTFILLIQTKEISKIAITDICKLAKVNRSTFYANYIDIYDLAEKLGKRLEDEFFDLYKEERENEYNSNDFLKLFHHIKENQLFYKTYFKLGLDAETIIKEYDYNLAKKHYDNRNIDYHIEFFKAGITAIIKYWLNKDCKESPEEMMEIIVTEYNK